MSRSEARRAQDRLRRDRLRSNGSAEPYTVAEIGERDGWLCGLCQDPVDRAYPHPDPRAPSLDHVRAVASGGTDTPGNVRLTHWGCNHERNSDTPLTTVEEARARLEVLRRKPGLRDYADSLTPEDMVRGSLARHTPERYRARLARRVERHTREGR
ncbi:HNH endonuclease [Streptomyces phaeofaciens]|uniref:HNH endonuclease n=1 Tax=Streptomyces phaeofaciens TaxID=68254 RepID=UPI0036A8713C